MKNRKAKKDTVVFTHDEVKWLLALVYNLHPEDYDSPRTKSLIYKVQGAVGKNVFLQEED
jgi:hypothetical protein